MILNLSPVFLDSSRKKISYEVKILKLLLLDLDGIRLDRDETIYSLFFSKNSIIIRTINFKLICLPKSLAQFSPILIRS